MKNVNGKSSKILYMLLVYILFALFACGCTASTEVPENKTKKDDRATSTTETFYKLQVQDAVLDENSILSAWIPSFDASQVTTVSDMEGVTKQVMMEGVSYQWTISGNTFNGYCDSLAASKIEEETAKQVGEQFVKALGYQISSVPSISKDEFGRINLDYTFQYEGVDILGNAILYIGQNDEVGTQGTYLSLTVDESGICSVCISNLMQIMSSVASYQKETDFVGDEQVVIFAESYYDQLVDESGAYSEDVFRTEVNIIYMPYLENGKKMLIPVYKVTAFNADDSQIFCAVLDALTGYVYSTQ